MKTFLNVFLAAGFALGAVSCQNADTQDAIIDPAVETITFNVTGMT